MQVHQGNLRQAVVYWFQPARRWPATRAAEELLRIFDAVTGNPQYAFVRVSSLDPKGTARDDLIELVAELAPRIRAEVEALGSSR